MKKAVLWAVAVGALAAVACAVLCAPAKAQPVELLSLQPPIPYAKYGWSVAGCGDINQDGHGDFILGAIYVPPTPGSFIQSGAAYVYSGKDGALLYEKSGNPNLPFGWFGYSVSGGGDVDGDGWPDFIVGGSADISVFSGASGNLLYHIVQGDSSSEPNNSVVNLGDVDGDQRADFAVGNPYLGERFAGRLTIFSGATGLPLYEHTGDSAYTYLGWSIANGGDTDGDGVNDLLVGAMENWGNPRLKGAVYVYSGRTGELSYRIVGQDFLDRIGWSIAGVGDIDKDGRGDFLVGAPYDSIGSSVVYSGADGHQLYVLFASLPHKEFGYSVTGTGDFNGDSISDFAVGERFSPFPTGGGEPGAAYVYSGRDGSLIAKLQGDSTGDPFGEDRMGWALGSADINADGRGDLICGMPSACVMGDFPYSGEVAVFGIPEPPVASCPKNMNVAIPRGASGATVTYVAEGLCTPASGSFFPVGWNFVICQGQNDYCWFNIHVHETGKP